MTDFRALCAELVETLAEHQDRLEDAYHPDHPEADRLDRSFRLLERARAALKAAADQCKIEWNYHPDYPETESVIIVSDLLAIAAELEGGND